jgi:hypothetical protein
LGKKNKSHQQVGQIHGSKKTSQIWGQKNNTLGTNFEAREGRTKIATKFYKVTNFNNPCYKFGQIISNLATHIWLQIWQIISNLATHATYLDTRTLEARKNNGGASKTKNSKLESTSYKI